MKNYVLSKSDIDNSLQDHLVKDKQYWQEDIAYMEMLKNSRKRSAQTNAKFKTHSNKYLMIAFGGTFLFLTIAIIIFHLKNEINEKIYAQFYSPLHTNFVIPTTSGHSNHTLDKAFQEYSGKNYSQALRLFNSAKIPADLYYIAQFYAGICDMELKHTDAALIHFNNIRQFSFLNLHVNWYKGLCNLQQGNLNEAIPIFNSLKVSDSPYARKAEKILNQLRK